jgi:hypothetical protein
LGEKKERLEVSEHAVAEALAGASVLASGLASVLGRCFVERRAQICFDLRPSV